MNTTANGPLRKHKHQHQRAQLVAAQRSTTNRAHDKQRHMRAGAPHGSSRAKEEERPLAGATGDIVMENEPEVQAATSFGGTLLDVRSVSQKKQTEESDDSSSPSSSRELLGRRRR